MADLSWRNAIIKVLKENKKPLHYTYIAQRIIDRGYRKNVGATPAASGRPDYSWQLPRHAEILIGVGCRRPHSIHQEPSATNSPPPALYYWTWWDAHRNPAATIRSAVEFHGRHLPAFQGPRWVHPTS